MTYSRSPSSSSQAPRIRYDVFISFRGSDTRRGFLSHLLEELRRKGVEAYVDYNLKNGSELMPALTTAIEESQISLVIFSEYYASSKWCLQELVKIYECKMQNGQIVIPIFYNVEPSDVRHQNRSYEEAFARHKNLPMDKVEKWRKTLKTIADFSGFDSKNYGTDAELVEKVVGQVLEELKKKQPVDSDLKGLIGINKPIEDLLSLISCCNGSKGVLVIGIWGMGGIGKTTIARSVFNKLYNQFEGCCFLNVRQESEKNGANQLRGNLLSMLLEDKDLNIGIDEVPYYVVRRLSRKKVMVVLDDVNNPDEIKNISGGHDWFGPGSIIMVTTRDKHVIRKEADSVYQVTALGSHDAMQLLNLHAFNGRCPPRNRHNVVQNVVKYAKGIPLALKVLGSFLHGKSVQEWESQLHKLQKMSLAGIHKVLRLSYDGLDPEEKSIFLNIACFFREGDTKVDVKNLLDACGYSTSVALKTLQDRALIIIRASPMGEYVTMHDLIREMGQEMVREPSYKKPGERIHLWDPDDIRRVLRYEEGTDRVESITLNVSRIDDLSLPPQSFAKMVNLTFLRLYTYSCRDSRVHLPEGIGRMSDKIKLFHWDGYPLKSLPRTFNAENLVHLRMQGSHVTKLWDGVQNLTSLKRVDLSESKKLMKLSDFSRASSLEVVFLNNCENLLSVHPSIFSLQKLVEVNLTSCERLEELPAIEHGGALKYLCLSSCKSLKYLPDSLSKLSDLEYLNLTFCKQLDTSNLHILFNGLQSLAELNMNGCRKLDALPENISNLSLLSSLSLAGTNIKSLPESIRYLSKLRSLNLHKCRMLQSLPCLPPSVSCSIEAKNVFRLRYEGLDPEAKSIFLYTATCIIERKGSNIKDLLNVSEYSTAMAILTLKHGGFITKLEGMLVMEDSIQEMARKILHGQGIGKPGQRIHLWDPNDIYRILKYDEGTEHIESIRLDKSRISHVSLSPHCFARMVNLKLLRFSTNADSDRYGKVHIPEGLVLPSNLCVFQWDHFPLKSLPATLNAENLVELCLRGSNVEKLWGGVQNLTNLQRVDLSASTQLIELPNLTKATSLETLNLSGCTSLLSIHLSIFALPKLVRLNLNWCKRLEEFSDNKEGAMLSSSVVWCSKLKELYLNNCWSLKHLPDTLSMLTSLEQLHLNYCKELNTSNLHILFDGLRSLQDLRMSECPKLNELPDNFSNLSSLRFLILSGSNVKRLPESIKHLSRLEWLWVNQCWRLQSVPEIPPSLCYLNADRCSSLERVFSPTPLLLQQRLQLFQNHTISKYSDTIFPFQECPKLDKQGVDAILAYAHSCYQGIEEIRMKRERERERERERGYEKRQQQKVKM